MRNRFKQLCLYLDSKIDIGVIMYITPANNLEEQPRIRIMGVTEQMWRKVLEPEIRRLVDIMEVRIATPDKTIVRLPHVVIRVKEKDNG